MDAIMVFQFQFYVEFTSQEVIFLESHNCLRKQTNKQKNAISATSLPHAHSVNCLKTTFQNSRDTISQRNKNINSTFAS